MTAAVQAGEAQRAAVEAALVVLERMACPRRTCSRSPERGRWCCRRSPSTSRWWPPR